MLKRFAQARRTGTYLRIVEEGTLEAGDRVETVSRPAHRLSIADFAHAYLEDRSQLPRLLIPEVSESWRDWVLETAA
jgi:MOSC domain-containing protein YiiM